MAVSGQSLGDRGRHLLQEYRAAGGTAGDFVDDRSISVAHPDESIASSAISSIHGFTPEVSFYDKRPNGGQLTFKYENGAAVYYCDGDPRPEFRAAQVIFQKNLIHVVFPDIQKSVVIPPSEAPELIPKLLDIFEAAGVQHNLRQKELLKLFLKTDKLLRAANQLYAKANHQSASLEVEVNRLQKVLQSGGSQADASSATGLHRESSVDIQRVQSLELDNMKLSSKNKNLTLEIEDLEKQLRVLQSPDSDNSVHQIIADLESRCQDKDEEYSTDMKKLQTRISELESTCSNREFTITKLELEMNSRANDLPVENDRLREELHQAQEVINRSQNNTNGDITKEDLQKMLNESLEDASVLRAKLTQSETAFLKATGVSSNELLLQSQQDLLRAREEIQQLTTDAEKMMQLNEKRSDLLIASEKQTEDLFKARGMVISFKERMEEAEHEAQLYKQKLSEQSTIVPNNDVISILESDATDMLILHEDRQELTTELLNIISSLDQEAINHQHIVGEWTRYSNDLQLRCENLSTELQQQSCFGIVSELEVQLETSIQLQKDQLNLTDSLLINDNNDNDNEQHKTIEQSNYLIATLELDLESSIQLQLEQSTLIDELLLAIQYIELECCNTETSSSGLERYVQQSNYLIQALELQNDEACNLALDATTSFGEVLFNKNTEEKSQEQQPEIASLKKCVLELEQQCEEATELLSQQVEINKLISDSVPELEIQLSEAVSTLSNQNNVIQTQRQQLIDSHVRLSIINEIEQDFDQSVQLVSEQSELIMYQNSVINSIVENSSCSPEYQQQLETITFLEQRHSQSCEIISQLELEAAGFESFCSQSNNCVADLNFLISSVGENDQKLSNAVITITEQENLLGEVFGMLAEYSSAVESDLQTTNQFVATNCENESFRISASATITQQEYQLQESTNLIEQYYHQLVEKNTFLEENLNSNNNYSQIITSLEHQINEATSLCGEQVVEQFNLINDVENVSELLCKSENKTEVALNTITSMEQEHINAMNLCEDQSLHLRSVTELFNMIENDDKNTENTNSNNEVNQLISETDIQSAGFVEIAANWRDLYFENSNCVTDLEAQLSESQIIISSLRTQLDEFECCKERNNQLQTTISNLDMQVSTAFTLCDEMSNTLSIQQQDCEYLLCQGNSGSEKVLIKTMEEQLEVAVSLCDDQQQLMCSQLNSVSDLLCDNRQGEIILELESQLANFIELSSDKSIFISNQQQDFEMFSSNKSYEVVVNQLEDQLYQFELLSSDKETHIKTQQDVVEFLITSDQSPTSSVEIVSAMSMLESELEKALSLLSEMSLLVVEQQNSIESTLVEDVDNSPEITSLQTQLEEAAALLKKNESLISEQQTKPNSEYVSSTIEGLEDQIEELLLLSSEKGTTINVLINLVTLLVQQQSGDSNISKDEIIRQLEQQLNDFSSLSDDNELFIKELISRFDESKPDEKNSSHFTSNTDVNTSSIISALEDQLLQFESLSIDNHDLISSQQDTLDKIDVKPTENSSGSDSTLITEMEEQFEELITLSNEKSEVIEKQQQQLSQLLENDGSENVIKELEELVENFISLSTEKSDLIETQLNLDIEIPTSSMMTTGTESVSVINKLEQQLDSFVELIEDNKNLISELTTTNTTDYTNPSTATVIHELENQLEKFISLSDDKTKLITTQQTQLSSHSNSSEATLVIQTLEQQLDDCIQLSDEKTVLVESQQQQLSSNNNNTNPDRDNNLVRLLEEQINEFLTLSDDKGLLISELLQRDQNSLESDELKQENEILKQQIQQLREAYSKCKKDSLEDDDDDSWGSDNSTTEVSQLKEDNKKLQHELESLRAAYSKSKTDTLEDDDNNNSTTVIEELTKMKAENTKLQQDHETLQVAYSKLKTDTLDDDDDDNSDQSGDAIQLLKDENKTLIDQLTVLRELNPTDLKQENDKLQQQLDVLQKTSNEKNDTIEDTTYQSSVVESTIRELEVQLNDSCDLNSQLLCLLQNNSSEELITTPDVVKLIKEIETQADDACDLCGDVINNSQHELIYEIIKQNDLLNEELQDLQSEFSSSSSSSSSTTSSVVSNNQNLINVIKQLESQLDECFTLLADKQSFGLDQSTDIDFFLLDHNNNNSNTTTVIKQLEHQLDESLTLIQEYESLIKKLNTNESTVSEIEPTSLIALLDNSVGDVFQLLEEQHQLGEDNQNIISDINIEMDALREQLRLTTKAVDDIEMLRSDEADDAAADREEHQTVFKNLSQQLEALQSENTKLKESCSTSQPPQSSTETTELRKRVEQLEQTLEGLARQDSSLSYGSDALESTDVNVLRKALQESRDQGEELDSDLDAVRVLLEESEQRAEEAEDETNESQRLINEMEARVTQLTSELADEIAEKTKISTELETMKMAATKTLAGLPDIENEMADLSQSRDINNPAMSAVITRIEAVVTELKLELASAREEAAKHKGEAEVLRNREVEYMFERKEVSVLQTRLSAAETQRDTSVSSLARAESERDDALQMYSDQLKKASSLESSLIEMQEPSQSAAAVWEATERTLRDKVSSLETECGLLQKNVSTAEGSRIDSNRLSDDWKQKHSELTMKLKSSSMQLREKEAEVENLSTQIETLQDTLQKQSQQLELFEKDQRLETHQLESTQNELSELVPLTNEVKELTEKLSIASRERTSAVEKKLDDEEEIRSLKRKVEALEQDLSEIRHHNAVLKDELVGYQTNVTTLTDELSFHRRLATNIDPSSPPSVVKSKNVEYNLKLKVSQLEEELRRSRHGGDVLGECARLADSESSVLAESVGKTLRASAEVVELCSSVKRKGKTQSPELKKELTGVALAAEGLVRSLTRKMQAAEPYLVSFTSHLREMIHVENIHKDPVCMHLLQHHRDHWCSGAEAAYEVLYSAQEQLISLVECEGNIDRSFTAGLLVQIKEARADSDSLWKPFSSSHERQPVQNSISADDQRRGRRGSSLTSAH